MPEIVSLGGGGGAASLAALNFDEQVYSAGDFNYDGTYSRVTLPLTPNVEPDLQRANTLHRNGVKDHRILDVTPVSPREAQISGNELLIFGDVTLYTLDEYTIVYVYTEA